MADCTHFKRKRTQNSVRSLNCTEWKSALTYLIVLFRTTMLVRLYDCYFKEFECSITVSKAMNFEERCRERFIAFDSLYIGLYNIIISLLEQADVYGPLDVPVFIC